MCKKLLSYIMSVLIVCLVLSFSAFGAAYESQGGNVKSYQDLFEILGGKNNAEFKYNDKGEIDHIYLINDVTLSAPVVITGGNYRIIGAGSCISATFTSGSFFIIKGKDTTLALGTLSPDNPEAVDLIFDGNNKTFDGSFVRVEDGAMLEMCSGVEMKDIISSASGSAVHNKGNFVMYGGNIKNCRAVGSGGAFYNEGESILALGTISKCSSEKGGAIFNSGKISLVGISIEECSATEGGAIYNSGTTSYASSTIKECKAPKGAGIFNEGTFEMSGGAVSNCLADSLGGGIYNASKLVLKGGTLEYNSAVDGGTVYNASQIEISENIQIFSGKASNRGANIFNAAGATIDMKGGSISSGTAIYGGGVYNAGTLKMSSGGIYSNQATVGEGILNCGTFELSGSAYVGESDDIFVMISDSDDHIVILKSDWKYKARRLYVSSGVFENGEYVRVENKGYVLIKPAGDIDITKRFGLFNKDSKFVLSSNGTLINAPSEISDTVLFIIGAVIFFPITVFMTVYAIRYFDKKRLSEESDSLV